MTPPHFPFSSLLNGEIKTLHSICTFLSNKAEHQSFLDASKLFVNDSEM
jgi:hypothetical protein